MSAALVRKFRAAVARNPEAAKAWMATLGVRQQQMLRYRLEIWARRDQLPPNPEFYEWLVQAGRGFGKTWIGSMMVRRWRGEGCREGILVGDTHSDIRQTMVEGPSGILALSPPWDRPRVSFVQNRLELHWDKTTGQRRLPAMRLLCYSAEKPDQIRGPNSQVAWLDEVGKFRRLKEVLLQIRAAVRIDRPGGRSVQLLYTSTPRRTEAYAALAKGSGVMVTRGRTFDNAANLNAQFLAAFVEAYGGTRMGKQELEGELLQDVEGALWTRELIENGRATRHGRWDGVGVDTRPWYIWDYTAKIYRPVPAFVRVVVGVDPSVADGRSDTTAECGIIVMALGEDGHIYVLEDASVHGSPLRWANAVVSAYERHFASYVVAEINQGGALVETNLRAVDAAVAYMPVHSKEGKRLRAQPLATWSERGKLHFLGSFPQLEDQMTSWIEGEASPDRLDALVHGATFLMGPVPTIH